MFEILKSIAIAVFCGLLSGVVVSFLMGYWR